MVPLLSLSSCLWYLNTTEVYLIEFIFGIFIMLNLRHLTNSLKQIDLWKYNSIVEVVNVFMFGSRHDSR